MGRNVLKLDANAFNVYAEKLDRMGGDLKTIFTDALEKAGQKIGEDTTNALAEGNLPRGGQYSTGQTEKTVVKNPKVVWSGMFGSIGVGFDFGDPGAGGYLITGTPRMKPDTELNKIYKRKSYMNGISKDIAKVFNDEINRRMGG